MPLRTLWQTPRRCGGGGVGGNSGGEKGVG